ncbi:alpha/beta-hydrolase [Fistulina hepatica ATCC 64428]|uniref:Alpha/beta-hydrolase n=1 Tax=Fistulina hepatica ATCC 64428 TaxID=1128425 RepID=A0A0D7AB39_9AGAR|nr:alpha/beta-hydrolase [Fistulina hepatica ATCC 64428]
MPASSAPNAATYRTMTTRREFTYRYIYAAPRCDKPFLLFLHGFPSTSFDWRYQVTYFSARGYGLIVPDMLGYAGTDKPEDPKHYTAMSLARDMIDLVDGAKAKHVIAIGHDWGAATISRLALLHTDRFIGFAWLAVGLTKPDPTFEYYAFCAQLKRLTGSEVFGYWQTMDREATPDLYKEKVDALLTLLYPSDPSLWKTALCPFGGLDAYLAVGKVQPLPKWLSNEDYEHMKRMLLDGGFRAPTNYYRVMVRHLEYEQTLTVDVKNKKIDKLIFYGGALQDYVCLAQPAKMSLVGLSDDYTTHEFDTSHWLQIEKPDEFNTVLEKWITLVIEVSKVRSNVYLLA